MIATAAPRLPRWGTSAVIGIAASTAVATFTLTGGVSRSVTLAWVVCFALPLWSALVEGRRSAIDRLATLSVLSAVALALLPLVSILWVVFREGAEFLTSDLVALDSAGDARGAYHAMVGTVLITGTATIISVPIGLFAAIYIVEYADGTRFSRWARLVIDVVAGIPSIIAGLFVFALFAMFFGDDVRLGIAGALALSVLMIPVVVRSTEEMLRVVPYDLRESSYALGVPRWRTVAKVVLPTALSGIVAGITLSIARVAGETAPLLIVAGMTNSVNFDLFDGPMATLPVFIFESDGSLDRAWGVALMLVSIVLFLNLVARFVSHFFSPKGEL